MSQECNTVRCLQAFHIAVVGGKSFVNVVRTLSDIEPDGAVRRRAFAALAAAMSETSGRRSRVVYPVMYVNEWFKQHKTRDQALKVIEHAIEIARWSDVGRAA